MDVILRDMLGMIPKKNTKRHFSDVKVMLYDVVNVVTIQPDHTI